MKTKTLLMGLMIFLLTSVPAIAFAKYCISINANEFTAEGKEIKFDKTYTQWVLKITNNLNIPTGNTTKLVICKNASTDSIDVSFLEWMNKIEIYVNTYKVFECEQGWESGKPLTIEVQDNYLKITHSNGTVLMENYAVGDFPVDKVKAIYGGEGTLTGFMTLEIDSQPISTTFAFDLLDKMIPVIIFAITLGLVVKALNKLQRKA